MNHTCCYSRWLATALTVVAAVFSASGALNAAGYVPRDVVWTTQSHNSSESMPCGGCDIGLNVWVEGGDLLFYAQQSGWFDENNTLLKAGRWRLRIDGQPFSGSDFRQRLCLDEGAIYISGGGVEVRLWVDVEQPVVFAAILSQHSRRAELSYENWRYRDRPVTKAECQQCSYKWLVPASCVTFADSISADADRLTFSHHNRQETVFDFTVSREQLDAIKDSLYNPIGSLLMQGTMQAPGFRFSGTTAGTYASTDFRAWNFRCDRLRRSVITITLSAGMSGTLPSPPTPRLSQKRSAAWWHQYWQRSWIVSNTPNDSLQAMLRNYELMRYMLGCNARGEWPTKFNGGLFTFDPVYADTALAFTPDYRKWGGGTMTAQNQRLVYWPLLKSGDYDVLQPQIETYRRMLPNALLRTRHYWGHGGASFTEQIENFGLPNPAEYGRHKEGDDPGVERNAWLEYEWDTALEFALMESLSSLTPAPYPKERGEPLGAEILRFFVEHYRWQARKLGAKELDADGRLIIYPGSGCETYKMAYNPSSTIAALQATAHLAPLTSADSLVPPIPLRVIGGDTCIAPAVAWARVQNVETPQLYPVWPWRIYGMGRPGLDIARNTYWKDPHALQMRSTKGWKQDNIWAACLGLTDEARRLNLAKLADGPYRFTAFYDPGFDWAPDHNRGGAGMVGLQEMLLQETPDGQPILFPAWPRQWNCSFRLRTLGGRTIEATIANGIIVYAEK